MNSGQKSKYIECIRISHLSGEVLKDGGAVDGGGGADAAVGGGPVLEVPVDAAHGELEPCAGGAGHGLSLGLARVLACLASGHRGLNRGAVWWGYEPVKNEKCWVDDEAPKLCKFGS